MQGELGALAQGTRLPSKTQNWHSLSGATKLESENLRWATLPAIVIAMFFAASLSYAQEKGHRFITIGTGKSTGAYYAVGKAICDAVNRHSQRRAEAGAALVTKCVAAVSGGSVFNIRQVGTGAFTFVIAQSNVARLALTEDPPEPIMRIPGLRRVMAMHDESLHVVVRKDGSFEKLSDLAEMPVNVGSLGSGTRQLFLRLAAAHDMSTNDFDEISNLSADMQVSALCEGRIAAFAMVTAVPAAFVEKAASTCDARLLSLDTDVEADLIASTPDLELSVIPRGTYPGVDADVRAISVRAGLYTRDAVPDDVVRELVEAVLSEIDLLRQSHPALANITTEEIHGMDTGVPSHRAATDVFVAEGMN